jgi:hypothetical protein
MAALINGYSHHTITEEGIVTNTKTNHIKSVWLGANDYYHVDIQENGAAKKHAIHRLLAKQFLPNLENKRTVIHIDGNKLNNNLSNLEWATDSENCQHAHDTGLQPYQRNYSLLKYEQFLAKVFEGNSLTSLAATLNQSLAQLSLHVKEAAIRLNKLDEYKAELKRQKSIQQKTANRTTLKVNMIDKTTLSVLATFNSLSEATDYLGKTTSGPISNVLSGRQKSAYGYFWERS